MFLIKNFDMQLELADSFLDDDMELTTLPALDPVTGEIYSINAAAMALLSQEEQDEIIYQAPFLIQKIQEQTNGTMSAGLFSKIKDRVNAFKAKLPLGGKLPLVAGAAAIIARIIQRRRESRKAMMLPPEPPEVEQAAAQQEAAAMPPVDPKFGLNIQVEPDPKPWFARPGVILPVIGGVVLIGALALRRKR